MCYRLLEYIPREYEGRTQLVSCSCTTPQVDSGWGLVWFCLYHMLFGMMPLNQWCARYIGYKTGELFTTTNLKMKMEIKMEERSLWVACTGRYFCSYILNIVDLWPKLDPWQLQLNEVPHPSSCRKQDMYGSWTLQVTYIMGLQEIQSFSKV